MWNTHSLSTKFAIAWMGNRSKNLPNTNKIHDCMNFYKFFPLKFNLVHAWWSQEPKCHAWQGLTVQVQCSELKTRQAMFVSFFINFFLSNTTLPCPSHTGWHPRRNRAKWFRANKELKIRNSEVHSFHFDHTCVKSDTSVIFCLIPIL